MPRLQKLFTGCAISLALVTACAAETPLRSPWDTTRIKGTNVPYVCPAPMRLSPDLTTSGFYSDSKGSMIDPEKWKAYAESSGPYKKLGDLAVDAADVYRTTGSRQAVECVVQLEKTATLDKALTGKMSSNQAYFVQGVGDWRLGNRLLEGAR